MLTTVSNKNFIDKKNSILKIKNIHVSGLSTEDNLLVLNDLNSLLSQNIFFIDKNEIIKTLNRNNLIHFFNVKKNYPNTVEIDLIKTDLIAITSKNNLNFFIGSNGKLIEYDYSKKKLPFVFGNVDFQKFINFKKKIDKSQFSFKDIESIYFFQSNRWDIKTKDDLIIKLPEKNLSNALSIAYKIRLNDILKKNKIIDLRIANHIIISE
jgi:cell division protein FtsQ